MDMRTRWMRAAAVVAVWMYALGAVLGVYGVGGAAALRVMGVVLLAVWARRSLTAWIFVAMLAGVELGVDAPRLAVQSKVFSDIFLRLIRMIVAPLILGTLVTGIAGHGSLRQVGRIGVKSLVYFEVVTTLALLIGVAAINLSKAGVGLAVSAALPAASTTLASPSPCACRAWLAVVFAECVSGEYCEVDCG